MGVGMRCKYLPNPGNSVYKYYQAVAHRARLGSCLVSRKKVAFGGLVVLADVQGQPSSTALAVAPPIATPIGSNVR